MGRLFEFLDSAVAACSNTVKLELFTHFDPVHSCIGTLQLKTLISDLPGQVLNSAFDI